MIYSINKTYDTLEHLASTSEYKVSAHNINKSLSSQQACTNWFNRDRSMSKVYQRNENDLKGPCVDKIHTSIFLVKL